MHTNLQKLIYNEISRDLPTKMQTLFIDKLSQLPHAIIDEMVQSDYVAIDTEFTRRSTYYAIPSLLQIANGKYTLIFDWQALAGQREYFEIIKVILEAPNLCKVLHAGEQDIEIILHNKINLCNIADTQIAMNFAPNELGLKQGLDSLISILFGEEMPKSAQNSNWQQRPLTSRQIQYAACDPYYIHKAFPAMRQIVGAKKWQYCLEDSALLLNPELYAVNYTKYAARVITKLYSMDAQRVACKLAVWRENLAIKKNKPRNHILKDEELVYYAKQLRFPAQYDSALLQLNEAEIEQITTECHNHQQLLKTIAAETLDKLRSTVNAKCQELNIVSTYCASGRDLQNFYINGASKLANGWRYEIIGHALNASF